MIFGRMSRQRSVFVKLTSILVVSSFIFSNVAFAIEKAENTPSQVAITDPAKIVIPADYGVVKSKFVGKPDRLVVHIQDAHCNYEAQTNIAKLLENLIRNYNLKLVSVEGADGFIDTSWFKAFPDDEVRKEVATYFMKKGEITGPEFLSITTDYQFKLFGAETRAYYIENLNAFTSSYSYKDSVEKYLNQIKAILNKLKYYIYSDELKTFDSRIQEYESKKMQFNDYVRFLEYMAGKYKLNLRAYGNLFKLVSVLMYEKKIDFKLTDRERADLIDELSKKITKDELGELVAKSLSFKIGKIASVEYYDYLKRLAKENDIDIQKKYSNLYNYVLYNAVYSRIENEKLFHDIREAEKAIKEKLFKNDDQRTLDKLSHHIEVLLGLVNIKLLNGDFSYYLTHKEEFSHEVFADFVKNKALQFGLAYELDMPSEAVAASIPKLESFYSIAIKRDKALIDNTLNTMAKEKQQITVLITGGFHSEGITKLLEKQDVSYIVVCPSITKDVASPYIQILTNQRTPFEEILTEGAGSAAATPAAAKAEAKRGMLAPYSIASAVKMYFTNPAALQEIEKGLTDRVKADIEVWAGTYVKRWYERVRANFGTSEFIKDRKIISEAFEIALNVRLNELSKLAEKEGYQFDAGATRAAIMPLASEAIERLIPSAMQEAGLAAWQSASGISINEMRDGLLSDIEYGKAASEAIGELERSGATQEDLEAFIKKVYTRRINIDRMRNVLTGEYKGYDVIIVSSSTEEEAKLRQEELDKLFVGITTGNQYTGNKVIALSIVDKSEGGQIIGQVNTWNQVAGTAKRLYGIENFDDLVGARRLKVAIYHNGGKGERFSPATQAINLSRAAQKLVGKVTNRRNEELELTLMAGVILETAPMAVTSTNGRIDTFWANQMAFGTVDFERLERSNFAIDKITIAVNKKSPAQTLLKELYDYGTAALSETGRRILRFLANKQLTGKKEDGSGYEIKSQPKYNALMNAEKAAFDYGSFSMSAAMHYALYEYWTKYLVFERNKEYKTIFEIMNENPKGNAGEQRDIDQALIQILVPLVNGLKGVNLSGIEPASHYREIVSVSARQNELDQASNKLFKMLPETTRTEINEAVANRTPAVAQAYIKETLGFFLLYRDNKEIFGDLEKVAGYIDLGDSSHWFAYKRLLDMANEKFVMLTDLIGKTIQIDLEGKEDNSIPFYAESRIRSEDARRMRGITADSIAVFNAFGQTIKLSLEEVQEGRFIKRTSEGVVRVKEKGSLEEGIWVKGSVIQGQTELLVGSSIVNSVVNDTKGRIECENSYVESTSVMWLKGESGKPVRNSIIFKVVDSGTIRAREGQIVVDVFRPDIQTGGMFPEGKTRFIARVGYDNKGKDENDKNKLDLSSRYTLEQIREEISCNSIANNALEGEHRAPIDNHIAEINDKYKKFKPLRFGTSGLRSAEINLTDQEVYINAKGYIRYLLALKPEKGGIKKGDTIEMAGDFRKSTPQIFKAIAAAIIDSGCTVRFNGNIPTPAVMLYGLYGTPGVARASIMITASHNKYVFNVDGTVNREESQFGIKFNKSNGEVLKADEPNILKFVARVRKELYFGESRSASYFDSEGMLRASAKLSKKQRDSLRAADDAAVAVNEEARSRYIERFKALGSFGGGRQVIFFAHTTVGRNVMPEILTNAGFIVHIMGWRKETEEFYALDTEKLTEDRREDLKGLVAEFKIKNPRVELFGVFTGDGDFDRPLVSDAEGNPYFGDKTDAIVAGYLRPDFVALPKTCNSDAIRILKSLGANVGITDVGSPFIVKEMNKAMDSGRFNKVLGYEANGGLLTGSNWVFGEEAMPACPTRDAASVILLLAKTAIEGNAALKISPNSSIADLYTIFKRHTDSDTIDRGTPTPAGLTPGTGFNLYTVEMGIAIKENFLLEDKTIAEVQFVQEGAAVKVLQRAVNTEDFVLADESVSEKAINMRSRLMSYFTTALGFDNVVSINFTFDIPQVSFANGDQIILRPSGNQAEFRVCAEAATEKRAREITRNRDKIMIGIVRDVAQTQARQAPATVTAPATPIQTVPTVPTTGMRQSASGVKQFDVEAIRGKLDALPIEEVTPETVSAFIDAEIARTGLPVGETGYVKRAAFGAAINNFLSRKEGLTTSQIENFSTNPDAKSLKKLLGILAINPAYLNKYIIVGYDTALDPSPEDQTIMQQGEGQINKYLGDRLINIRGTGVDLLNKIRAQAAELKESGSDFVVVTITGNETAESVEAAEKSLAGLGKVIQVQNTGKDKHIPVIGLYELAIRIAYDIGKEEDFLECLNRIGYNGKAGAAFTAADVQKLIEDLKTDHFIIRILPKIRPADLKAAHEAYKAARQALISL